MDACGVDAGGTEALPAFDIEVVLAQAGAKRTARERLRALRDGMDAQHASSYDRAIAHRVLALLGELNASCVYTYISVGSEVDTRQIVSELCKAGVPVAVPRVTDAHKLAWHELHALEELVPTHHGLLEPRVSAPLVSLPAVPGASNGLDAPAAFDVPDARRTAALVPGFTFDHAGYRLGYGGGFYDAFLAQFPDVAIGLCRAAFLAESLGSCGLVEAHDQPVSYVVTETTTLRAHAPARKDG